MTRSASSKYTEEDTINLETGTYETSLKLERIDSNQSAYVSGIAVTLGFKGEVPYNLFVRVGHESTPADDDFISAAVVMQGGKIWMPIKRRLNDSDPALYVHLLQGSGTNRDCVGFWTCYGKMLKVTTYS